MARGDGRYIVCLPAHRGSEVDLEALGRRGRYREVAPNLKVKEVVVGEGERRRRYAVCFNQWQNPTVSSKTMRHLLGRCV